MATSPKPYKIAYVDIETAPNIGYAWAKWETNIIDFLSQWYMMSFCVKWSHTGATETYSLPMFPSYKRSRTDDRALVKKLWEVFNEADCIVAHNGDKFDIRKANTRFIYHKLPPPSPYRTIDTLKLARSKFGFTSNTLDDLGEFLGEGRKVKHEGFGLWLRCMNPIYDPDAWALMETYNTQDVELLERIYLRLRPWHTSHPNVAIAEGLTNACPACGSIKTQRRGWSYTLAYRIQRFQCRNCGKWSKGTREKVEGTVLT